jgi:hypothetical protein
MTYWSESFALSQGQNDGPPDLLNGSQSSSTMKPLESGRPVRLPEMSSGW